ncbi:MAG: hypothetical protein MI974_15490 [Chitinophagales bacterium]|nr:hypothetical protein [Chitinophagales bacterium]
MKRYSTAEVRQVGGSNLLNQIHIAISLPIFSLLAWGLLGEPEESIYRVGSVMIWQNSGANLNNLRIKENIVTDKTIETLVESFVVTGIV